MFKNFTVFVLASCLMACAPSLEKPTPNTLQFAGQSYIAAESKTTNVEYENYTLSLELDPVYASAKGVLQDSLKQKTFKLTGSYTKTTAGIQFNLKLQDQSPPSTLVATLNSGNLVGTLKLNLKTYTLAMKQQ